MKAIGIGCFWFADARGQPTEDDDDNRHPKDHISEIEQALESIDNISNLKMLHQGDSYVVAGESFSDDEEDDTNYYPLISNVRIEFDILIPERLQKQFSFGRRGDSGVESFHVTTIYDGGLPITYVSYAIDGGEIECHTYAPSTAIIFIREYLKEKLLGHKMIEFGSLGPSPFHADFFVVKKTGDDEEIVAKDISFSGIGYRTLYYEIPCSEEELVDSFAAINQPILSAYYSVVRYGNKSASLGALITAGARLLISRSQRRRFPAIRHWFRQGLIIDDIYKSILDQKINNISLANFLAESKANETIDTEDIIYRFIDREANDQFSLPVEDVKDMLKMLEDRRQGYIRNTTTIASGLIGGILGASLTFLFGFYSAHTSPHNSLSGLHPVRLTPA